jgi:hypothetical protein
MEGSSIAEKHCGVRLRLRIIRQCRDGTLYACHNGEQLIVHRGQALVECRLQRFQLCGFLAGKGGGCTFMD